MKSKDTQNYYDDFSSWYENERHHGYHSFIDELQTDIVKQYADNKDVLEIGCGTGLIMDKLKDTARSISGVDLSRGMLQPAQQRGFNVVQGMADKLPFDDASFDLVYSFKVLAHVPPIEQALQEMSRVLRPGGLIIADFYNSQSVRYLAKKVGGPGKISETRNEAEVFTRWDRPQDVIGYLPSDVTFKGWRGVRVFTPFARAHRIPVVRSILGVAERAALKSPFSRFGGFLVAVCEKRSA